MRAETRKIREICSAAVPAPEPPDPEKRSPAPSAKGDRAKAKRRAGAKKNYRKSGCDSTPLKAVATFHGYNGRTYLGIVRDCVTTVEAIDRDGHSLGFFRSRSEALRALGGAK